MNIPIECVTRGSFAPFGDILEFPPGIPKGGMNDFQILIEEKDSPWRIAVRRFNNRDIPAVGCHPDSRETFEPLYGASVLVVAEYNTPRELRAFFLDKPVCLKKNIWHHTLALSEEAALKITENLEVGSEWTELAEPVSASLCSK
ncbi:MAG: hypothetical protein LBL26_01265 [Peptococcaceae bacterium]|jgi:ureidoglycolate hydrolase|nr:hypothetical protein [Peptococcaceae bacterium]